jgi:hypothetical protein
VLDQDVNNCVTLRVDFSKDFKGNNSCETAERTVMKATWLSKVDATKKVGSMVVWLKTRIDAGYLLRTGTAIFGATDAFCSPFIVRDNSGPCYHCNRYGLKQMRYLLDKSPLRRMLEQRQLEVPGMRRRACSVRLGVQVAPTVMLCRAV